MVTGVDGGDGVVDGRGGRGGRGRGVVVVVGTQRWITDIHRSFCSLVPSIFLPLVSSSTSTVLYPFSKVSGCPGAKILNRPVLGEALNPSSNYREATLNLYNIFKG